MKKWDNGDLLKREENDVILYFSGKRKTLSTSRLNGGYREDLSAVFNHCDRDLSSGECIMKAATYKEHLALAAKEAGLDPGNASGVSTAVDMKYAVIAERSWENLSVTAIVTGGILVNGRRCVDEATMWEDGEYFRNAVSGGEPVSQPFGTINTLVYITADLTPDAMVSAVMICAEAKAAAIQDVGLKSCYSGEIATGSGTDGIIIVSDMTSLLKVTQCRTDVKSGECVARAVYDAIKRSLLWNLEVENKKFN